MDEILLSAAVSVIMVVVEYVGLAFTKWTIARHRAEKERVRDMTQVLVELSRAGIASEEELGAAVRTRMEAATLQTRRAMLRAAFAEIVPGPELSFLSLTVLVSLFLSFSWADGRQRAVMSPLLAGTRSAFPIMLLAGTVIAVLWIVTLLWREALVTDVQKRFRKLSLVAIATLGCCALGISIYLLTAGRS
jgi:hypothetical protein